MGYLKVKSAVEANGGSNIPILSVLVILVAFARRIVLLLLLVIPDVVLVVVVTAVGIEVLSVRWRKR